jgi:monofunctional biosynthetic peptidoglycan transglycosylase
VPGPGDDDSGGRSEPAREIPAPLGPPPLPDLELLGPPEPAQRAAKRRRPLWRRALLWLVKLILAFILLSVLMVLVYRFVPPPVTWTMIGDVIGGHGVRKNWMPLSRIDPTMPRAAIAAEDSRFCAHHGFDVQALEEAYRRNQKGGRIRGGSTISQQTAKNVFLWQGGGYFRKGLEAYFTVLIENIWGKRRIMEVYLNVAETGIGTYGVNAGAMRYFRHDASRLSPREAAQIAAVLPLPKKRAAIDPRGFTRRYGNSITARIGVVRGDGLDACLR